MKRHRLTNIDKRDSVNWRDTGCSVSPSCLDCPLPACKYDVAGGLAALQCTSRNDAIASAREQGTPVSQLQDRFNLSRRTVFRALSAGRRFQSDGEAR
jgi:hypothetical protein